MIALDTNILVRFLVRDDPKQSAKAAKLIARASAADEGLYLSDIVLCETVWVLTVSYEFTRAEIASALLQLLKGRNLVFSSSDRVSRALEAYARGKGDFAGYMIREDARQAGCEKVATFDRALLADAHFVAP